MITSTSNAKVKRLVNLKKKKKLRDEEGVFLVEGIRMFREVPKDRLVEVYASEEFWNRERKAVEQVLAGTKVQPEILAVPYTLTSLNIFASMAVLMITQKICIIYQSVRPVPETLRHHAPTFDVLSPEDCNTCQ